MKSISVLPMVLSASSQQPHEVDFNKSTLEKARLMPRHVESRAQGATVSEGKTEDT